MKNILIMNMFLLIISQNIFASEQFPDLLIYNENKIFLASNWHFWGNGRMTGRLLVFNSEYGLIGMYTIGERPRTEGKKLVFDVPNKLGNIVDFTNGIPSEIWIDGEIYGLMLAKDYIDSGANGN